jgi:hypothetical protein
MARPTVYDRPMTPAERQERHRNAKRNLSKLSEAERRFYCVPMRTFARHLQCSERQLYHIKAFQRDSLIEWPNDILNGKFSGASGSRFSPKSAVTATLKRKRWCATAS